MNLHILPDSKFTEAFYRNMAEAGLLANNIFVVRSRAKKLKYVKQSIPFASLYRSEFDTLVGDISKYERVYIHQLSPLLYRWIATHKFQELNWMSWGTDLYNLPFVKVNFYERETSRLIRTRFDIQNWLYLLKVYLTNMLFKRTAYSRINNMLTWMRTEFDFARKQIPELKALHQYFFYENQLPYEKIKSIVANTESTRENKLKLIVGNSGTAGNNHLDAIRKIDDAGMEADLFIPVSYGDKSYISQLKKSSTFYKGGSITFIDVMMEFEEYVRFLYSADALIMNHIRPQGYGNVFIMMYMNKPVFFNDKNLSLPDLASAGLRWNTLDQLRELNETRDLTNRSALLDLLAHDRLLKIYRDLFGS
jgi:dTDP-N-acetylfucosamine:lipid II N-acetylfucosaminyltransferase